MPVDGISGSTAANYNINRAATTDSKTDTENNGSLTDRLDKVPDADYSYSSGNSSAPSKDLTSTDFLKLLAAQLQYQDMTNPMSNTEMMSTLTQMSSMNATNAMVNAISTMTSSMNDVLTVNLTSYATGMMGKEVTVALLDKDGKATGEKITGKVDGISLYEGSPMVYVDGKRYELSQVMSIGTVPAESDSDKTDTDKTDTDKVDADKNDPNTGNQVDTDKTDTNKTDSENTQQSAGDA